jgi:hypothetical protein
MPRSPFPSTTLMILAVLVLVPLVLPVAPSANPMKWGRIPGVDSTTSLRWPDSTKIKVYIPEYPDSTGKADCVRQGIQRWAGLLAKRGITLEFHVGQTPPTYPTTNCVGVGWVPNETLGGPDGRGDCKENPATKPPTLKAGKIQIENDALDCTYLKNLAMHEFGHVLGFADDRDTSPGNPPHNAMDPTIPDWTDMTFSKRDSSEWETLYNEVGGAPPHGDIFDWAVPDPGMGYLYTYEVTWTGGPEIPIFELNIGTYPAEVAVLSMPPGWELDYPPEYICGFPGVPADPTTPKLHFRSVGEGLSETDPVGTFVVASTWPPGPGWGHAMLDNDADGAFDPIPLAVPVGPTGGIPPEGWERPATLRVLTPSPNPFRDGTTIRFQLEAPASRSGITIFDASGRRVRALEPGALQAGEQAVRWDGRDGEGRPVPGGVYFYRVTADGREGGGRLVRTP